jgi:hypothetical protein
MANGLIKDIKGCHIHVWLSSESPIDKSNWVSVSPVIVACGLPNLVILGYIFYRGVGLEHICPRL